MEIAGIVIALILVLIACIYFLLPTKKQEEEPKITEKITEKEESKPKKSEKQPRKHSRTIKNVQQDIEEVFFEICKRFLHFISILCLKQFYTERKNVLDQ